MWKPSITVIAAVLLWMISFCSVVNADDAGEADSTMPVTLPYIHLYTDPGGMTHFRDEIFEFHAVNQPGSPADMSYHELAGAGSATLVRLKKGVVEDWHTAPRTQFAVVVQGVVQLTAGDGEVRRLTTGMMALLDDTTGKGHITAALGDEDHIALMIPVNVGARPARE